MDDRIAVKKIHLLITLISVLVGSIFIPLVTVSGSYYQAKVEIQKQISDIQVQSAQTFATKSDIEVMREKVDRMASDVSEIKGFLYKKR